MDKPTFDSQSGQEPIIGSTAPTDSREIVSTLLGYKEEAKQARKGGDNPRDDKWLENLNLYWNRHDFSMKANWQAKEALPEVPAYVDRFAGSLKEALLTTNGDFYAIVDPTDVEGDLANAIKGMTDLWLNQSGQNNNGNILDFPAVFEEQMKLGALMATSSVTTWKTDISDGRVSIEAVDPRNVWLDHTGRNLYRIRRIEVDKHELTSMAAAKDSSGASLFNLPDLDALVTSISLQEQRKREELAGSGAQVITSRSPIILDEYVATVVDSQGKKAHDRSLFVVANDEHLIRGPEANPFWHGKDWLTFSPLVTVPLSVYGRSYMEDFGSIAKTLNTLTNMLIDAVNTSALKAWVMVPGMLINPGQVAEGITPNKIFQVEDGYDPRTFATALEMGTLPNEAIAVWKMLKDELSEAASINEIGLGQFAPKGRTSASEVMAAQQNSGAMVRSLSQSVETRWLNPTLDLVWKTGLQHMKKNSRGLTNAAGKDMFDMIYSKRKEFVQRPMTFRAQGLSEMIQRAQSLKSLLAVLQIVGSNPALAQLFMQQVDMNKFLNMVFQLSNIDPSKLEMSARDKMIQQITQPLQQAGMPPGAGPGAAPPPQQNAGPPKPSTPAASEMTSLAKTMGIAK